jgi:hypothetical protein
VVYYPYQIISTDPMVPPAPILRVELFNPIQDSERRYELDTGEDCTLIPLEALSVLRLPLLGDRFPVQGVGGATTTGFLCQAGIHVGVMQCPEKSSGSYQRATGENQRAFASKSANALNFTYTVTAK